MTTAAEVLERALQILPGSWVNAIPEAEFGERCAVTAINEVTRFRRKRAKQFLCEAIGRRVDDRYMDNLDQAIIKWNDAPSRTWPEVRQAFERAIALARQEQQ